ncbi:MAG: PDZ domain-containing protein, partial [Acidobacteria bacterium]|nr:PDZ domain-containing protein [Acidobacteriota bacterium]
MVPKLLKISTLARMLSLSSLLLLLLPAGGSASTPAPAPPAPPAPPARMARTAPPAPTPAPDADSDDQDHPKRGWLGVFLSEDEDEVIITGVKDGSPAEKAGLKEGDKIVEIDSKKVDDSGDIRNVIRQLEPGDTVQVVVMRDGKKKTVTATLGEAPKHFWGGEGFSLAPGEGFGSIGFPGMGMSRTYLGVRVQGMTEELRAYFKAPRGRGVLVSRVDEDTPAGKAGLRAGDVIIAVDGKGIANRGDIGAALADKEPGDTVAVKIVRDGSEKTLDVEVAERPTPKARHGSLLLPDEDKEFLFDEEDMDDLEELHEHEMDAVPDNSRIQLEIERAIRQAQKAMRNSEQNQEIQREICRAMQAAQEMAQADVQRQVQQELARVQDSTLLQKEAIRQQVEAAMDQARQALREAAEAARMAEESS